jgi:Secretion system C-terminal sorting domain/PKD-like domain
MKKSILLFVFTCVIASMVNAQCTLTNKIPVNLSPGAYLPNIPTINTLTPTLSCDNISGVGSWSFYIRDSITGVLVLSMRCASNVSSYTVLSGTLQPGRIYKFNVQGVNICNGTCWTQYAKPSYFKTAPACTPTNSTTNGSICAGGSYFFNGNYYYVGGAYTVLLTNAAGCDSAANLVLAVAPYPTISSLPLNTDLCVGNSVQLNNALSGGVWVSGNTNIAAVDAAGYVTGVAAGATYIGYSVTNSFGCTATTSNNITVNDFGVGLFIGGVYVVSTPQQVTYTANPIAGATNYSFTYSGSDFTLGQNGSNVCTINFGSNATSGCLDVTATNASGCSKTASLCITVTNPLPTALDFYAAKIDKHSKLVWKTFNEINVSRFIVERSTSNERLFKAIGSVDAKGNSANYELIDLLPHTGNNYYRLKILDNDGKFSYSPIRVLNFNETIKASLFPNPTTDALNVTGDIGFKKIIISDVLGKIFAIKEVKQNTNNVYIDVSFLKAGTYFVNLVYPNGKKTLNFIKQ